MSNPPARRSYTGCWTCRRRRRKCDGQRPVCHTCEARNIHCEGYDVRLRWGTGIASRGLFTGAELPVKETLQPRTPGRRLRRTSRPPASAPGQSPPQAIAVEASCSEAEETQSSPSSRILADTGRDRDLFCQFLETGCQALFSTKILAGSFSGAMSDLCKDSQACYTVCIALQASLIAGMQSHFLEYFDIALQHFRCELGRKDKLSHGALTAGILICASSIFHGMQWTLHVEGLYRFMNSPGGGGLLQERGPVIDELIEALGVLDLSSFIIARRYSPMYVWYRHCRHGARSTPCETTGAIQPVLGLPRSLVDIFSAVGLDASEEDFLHWPGEIGTFSQMHLWEAYRCMGVLCIRSLKRKAGDKESPPGDGASGANYSPSTEIIVGRLLSAVDAINRLQSSMSEEEALILDAASCPLFISGSEPLIIDQHPEWKKLVVDGFSRNVKDEPYSQTGLLLESLQELWSSWRHDSRCSIETIVSNKGLELGLI